MASAPAWRVMASRLGQVSTQLKSPPAEKALPSPVTTITRTASSAAKPSTASRIARAVSASRAFISLPRQRRRVATPSSTAVWTVGLIVRSHPEDAELGRADRLVHRRGQAKRQRHAGVDRVEDAVVPQARRCIVGMALAVVLLDDRLLERGLLLFRPRPTLGFDV